ncbi:sugar ABC transporter permease [Haloferax mediterranei ATCC 33500]|uniref:ABC transporter permease n=1 Tax=Haloferax mediterranei (strain ATCC 33500 / DSM 1411 / JCM 8866 / NBRC 14739 / NCIMB 2177 / R-4) TaxID=523841 RepID=I3R8K5_HALMT|nr:sugar ABC transporter permease [Haloferax mediterranei]AFK20565.1 sugar ABC transporter permease protein [Haloferax mediterranei ATCC 33500]AHZ23922.1 ABC transporter permease [Haloferax mediterranei ATCC 33500]ELZ98347.1 sugar ABC transporter permease [Haloferax mediterranei ATCC 33500]MDX5986680.1 sugar ABC transporter permease [Haloferax mediterranei ATCC 33500]
MSLHILKRLLGRDRDDGPPVRTDGGTTSTGGEASATDESDLGALLSLLRESEAVQSAPFWLPPFLLMGFFVYGAIGWNVIISFTDFAGLQLPAYDPSAFDLEMYRRAFSDGQFWAATRNTFVLLVSFTALSLGGGLGLAILIDRGIRFENWFRTIYLLPFSLSFVVTAVFWRWMYNFDSGVINVVLRGVGLDFLASKWLAGGVDLGLLGALPLVPETLQFKLFAVIFALLWQFSGYAMVVYLAGLRAIPSDQYEAARVDGASTLRMYRRVILPQLRASTVSAAVVLMVFALKAFDFLYVMFGNNPGPTADILSTMMYRQAFAANEWAYGSAIAVVLFVVALAVVAPYLYGEYRRGEL